MSSPTLSGQNSGLTMDLRSLDRLKAASGQNAASQSTIKETARQLEGLFMQELMKSMRATTMSSGMLDNSGTEMGQSMLDTQLATQMTGLPRGLSALIERQLSRQMGVNAADNAAAPATSLNDLPARPTLSLSRTDGQHVSASLPLNRTIEARLPAATLAETAATDVKGNRKLNPAESFVRKHQAAADAAERATGIPSANILGQAALESGWGKREIRANDGSNSHNLFGIKATANWKGKVAEVTTTEYIGGWPARSPPNSVRMTRTKRPSRTTPACSARAPATVRRWLRLTLCVAMPKVCSAAAMPPTRRMPTS